MDPQTCCRFQGLLPGNLVLPDADGAVRRLLGNAMSLFLLESLMRTGLIATGKLQLSTPNRWADGTAQCELLFDAWGAHLDEPPMASLPRHVLKAVSDGHRNFSDTRLTVVANCLDQAAGHLRRDDSVLYVPDSPRPADQDGKPRA